MAKLGERELMEGVKQGAIVGVGVALLNAAIPLVPFVKDWVGMLPVIPLGPVAVDVKMIVYAIGAAIGGNYIVSMFK